MPSDLIAELKWRGLFHQCTDEAGLHAHLASGMRRGYVGYDPTADSLTIGNLDDHHAPGATSRTGRATTPVVVAGGGTGLIGDPSGKSAERHAAHRASASEANVAGPDDASTARSSTSHPQRQQSCCHL
jgi:tyrosyl-tRNA synthetase